ncbi:MAG: hypothetical protein U0670_12855 [Anaerolineae bacterium]
MDTRLKDVASRLRTAVATSSSDAAALIKRDSSSANSTEPSDANAQLVLRVHEALLRFGAAAVESLLGALPTATGGFQLHLIKLLGEIGDERAWEPLMDLLEIDRFAGADHGGAGADSFPAAGSNSRSTGTDSANRCQCGQPSRRVGA